MWIKLFDDVFYRLNTETTLLEICLANETYSGYLDLLGFKDIATNDFRHSAKKLLNINHTEKDGFYSSYTGDSFSNDEVKSMLIDYLFSSGELEKSPGNVKAYEEAH